MTAPKWALLTPGGELEEGEGAKPSLTAMQNMVGGLVEHIGGPHGEDLWINEEGKYTPGLRENVGATEYLRRHGRLFAGDFIMGTMVFTAISAKRWEKLREEFPEGQRALAYGITLVKVQL